jgi:hypothetical protein
MAGFQPNGDGGGYDPQQQQFQQQQQQPQDGDFEQENDLENDPSLDHNRIFARAQKALSVALEREFTKNNLQAIERDEEVKRGQQRREKLGVELYGLQQQLAKQQMFLERTHEKHTATEQVRREERVFV